MLTYETNDGVRRVEIRYNTGFIGVLNPLFIKDLLIRAGNIHDVLPTKEHRVELQNPGPYPHTLVYTFEALDGKTWEQTLTFTDQIVTEPTGGVTIDGDWTQQEINLVNTFVATLAPLNVENDIQFIELKYW